MLCVRYLWMHVIIWECSMRNSVVQRGSSDLYRPQSTEDVSLASRHNTNSFIVSVFMSDICLHANLVRLNLFLNSAQEVVFNILSIVN